MTLHNIDSSLLHQYRVRPKYLPQAMCAAQYKSRLIPEHIQVASVRQDYP